MKSHVSRTAVVIVQIVLLGAGVAAWQIGAASPVAKLPVKNSSQPYRAVTQIPRTTPLVITPLYDDVEVVSDEELAAVLAKIRPVFSHERTKPNFVEHALRAWSVRAKFADPRVMSGEQMKDFLTDHGKYLASWGDKVAPLLSNQTDGVDVRWGSEEGASVHHDHWLACLTEAGISLNEPVFTASHRAQTIADVLEQALSDFRLDETEVEWSVMAFGLWISPQKEWRTRDGRHITFDMLADRLMRGDKRFGICSGTHRVYSLMVLIRLDEEFQILTPETHQRIMDHLRSVRDLITVCQFPDGHWPSNWSIGADALEKPVEDELYKRVIATGHHLEWLAIAPQELHPPREQILKAADWLIQTTHEQTADDINGRYTFFSHVGNALALWRNTHPSEFWATYFDGRPEPLVEVPASARPKADEAAH